MITKKQRWFAGIVILMFAALFAGCSGDQTADSKAGKSGTPAKEVRLTVKGMTCGGCEQMIEKEVGKLAGVNTVKASFRDSSTVVKLQDDSKTLDAVVQAIHKKGYSVAAINEDATPNKQ